MNQLWERPLKTFPKRKWNKNKENTTSFFCFLLLSSGKAQVSFCSVTILFYTSLLTKMSHQQANHTVFTVWKHFYAAVSSRNLHGYYSTFLEVDITILMIKVTVSTYKWVCKPHNELGIKILQDWKGKWEWRREAKVYLLTHKPQDHLNFFQHKYQLCITDTVVKTIQN